MTIFLFILLLIPRLYYCVLLTIPQNQTSFDDIEPDNLLQILHQISPKTSLQLGQVNRHLYQITRTTNKKTRISSLSSYCDPSLSLNVTSNGWLIFSNNLYGPQKGISLLCLKSLNWNRYSLSRLQSIVLDWPPGSFSSRRDDYNKEWIYQLDILFKHKPLTNVKIIFPSTSSFWFIKELFIILGSANIHSLELVGNLNIPIEITFPLTINSNIKHLIVELPCIIPYLHLFPYIESLSIPEENPDPVQIQSIIENSNKIHFINSHPDSLALILNPDHPISFSGNQITGLKSELTSELASLLSNHPFPLNDIDLRILNDKIWPKLHEFLIFQKPNIKSLTLRFGFSLNQNYVSFLECFLSNNPTLNKLEITDESSNFIGVPYLYQAFNLTHFSYTGRLSNEQIIEELCALIESQKNLQTFHLFIKNPSQDPDMDDQNPSSFRIHSYSFLDIYKKIVSSIKIHETLKTVEIRVSGIECVNGVIETVNMFTHITQSILGMNVTLNSVPVERIVDDVRDGLGFKFKNPFTLFI